MATTIGREAIYAALMSRFQVQLATLVKTFYRKYKHPEDVPDIERPALICVAEGQKPIQQNGLPTKWILSATAIIYAANTNSERADASPETGLLNIIDAVEAALARQALDGPASLPEEQYHTTLGGVVRRVWISGEVEVYPGIDSEQAIAVIPLEMLAVV